MTRHESLSVLYFRAECSCMTAESKRWLGLIGKPVDEAEEIIKEENPGQTSNSSVMVRFYLFSCLDYQVEKLAVDSPVTEDFRSNRVRIFYDEQNKVAKDPESG